MEVNMKVCSLCGETVEADKYFSRKSTCHSCSGDLHICLNCTFYSESKHNKCNEPKAEFQRTRDMANFCDYFVFRETMSVSSGSKKAEAIKDLEDLFRKKE
jgi:hypothetical protein